MRVLVTGSRRWTDEKLARRVLRILWEAGFTELVHGDQWDEENQCGLDRMAGGIAAELGFAVAPFPARWTRHGKAAGSIRNQQMVDFGADLCVAFPLDGSRGTWDCVSRCDAAEIPVVIVRDGLSWESKLEGVLTRVS